MKRNLSQEILIIAVLALTATLIWLYLGVHQALKKSEKPILSPKQTQTLSPKLDTSVFEELVKRKM